MCMSQYLEAEDSVLLLEFPYEIQDLRQTCQVEFSRSAIVFPLWSLDDKSTLLRAKPQHKRKDRDLA